MVSIALMIPTWPRRRRSRVVSRTWLGHAAGLAAWVLAPSLLCAGLAPEQLRQLPPAAQSPVVFTRDIQPILETGCLKCHARGKDKGGLRMDNRAEFLKGGDSGPAVKLGDSAGSLLIEMVSGLDLDNVMPRKGSRLKPAQVGLLRAWIDQGAPWDPAVSFAKMPTQNLHPRRPELPPADLAAGITNPVDRLLLPYLAAHQLQWGAPVEDRLFARRTSLDVTGLLPEPQALAAFLADPAPDKRARWVRRLLADNAGYATHWLSFWNDLLRNDYKGTGYIDGGRKQITGWLYRALATNLPYPAFVSRLVNPDSESEGFANGIVWRGAVNSSQSPPLQAAQNIAQVFLGINLKCASCHDSFINDWALTDAYGLAQVYAEAPLEIFRCDKPTGQQAVARFPFPELGSLSTNAPRAERLQQLAGLMTSPQNGRVPRTLVNRLWARLLGRGLVEPVDEMDQAAWYPDLLDWLAEDFVASGGNVKHTLEVIMTSRAYQLPAVSGGDPSRKDFVFAGPWVRRLTAEEFRDALTSLTGVGYEKPVAKADWAAGTELAKPAGAHWLWLGALTNVSPNVAKTFYRKTFLCAQKPARAVLGVVTGNDSFQLYVNGQNVGAGKDPASPGLFDVSPYCVAGENLIAIVASQPSLAKPTPAKADKSKREKTAPGQPRASGLWVYAQLQIDGRTVIVGSDETWIASDKGTKGWEQPGFAASQWAPAPVLGEAVAPPLAGVLASAVKALEQVGCTRASLVTADPLALALGRPNREQVLSVRSPEATTLQALEMTNGETLAAVLRQGAEHLLARHGPDTGQLVARLYRTAFGRPPSSQEARLAAEALGRTASRAGVEDYLWSLVMLPEFQLIY